MKEEKEIVENVAEEAVEKVVKKRTSKKKAEVTEPVVEVVKEAPTEQIGLDLEPKAEEKIEEFIVEEVAQKEKNEEGKEPEVKKEPEKAPQVETKPAKAAAVVRPKKLEEFGGFKVKGIEKDLKPKVVIDRKIEEKYKKLQKDNEVIWARVVGSEEDKSRKHSVGAVCDLGDGQRAIIPDSLYFMPDTQFDEKYDEQSDAEKARIRKKFISYQIGAIVCFTVFSVSTDKDKGLTIFGNRIDAMNKLQDFYFTHINYPQTESNTIAVGDKTQARILTVRSHKLFVECCGVETFLSPYYLSNDTVVNCKDFYKPGDVIEVTIRKLYTEPKNYISLTARNSMSKEKMHQIVKGSTYLGTVDRIDPKKGTISVRLANGLNISVLREKIVTVDPKTLAKGDKVIVEVTKVLESFAQGFVIAKC